MRKILKDKETCDWWGVVVIVIVASGSDNENKAAAQSKPHNSSAPHHHQTNSCDWLCRLFVFLLFFFVCVFLSKSKSDF